MFGPPEVGRIVAPYTAERKNGVSWTNFVNSVFDEIGDVPVDFCWMVGTLQIKITAPKTGGGTRLCASVVKTRLIYFLTHPSVDCWEWLLAGNPEEPFDHWCGRGLADSATRLLCVNGFKHGEPATRAINEDRKLCKRACRATCDGHGTGHKCVFTHPDGTLKPCCMVEDHLPKCEHIPPCFPFSA